MRWTKKTQAYPAPVRVYGVEQVQGVRQVAQTTVYAGRHGRYTLNSFGAVKISLHGCEREISLDKAGLEEYITELMDIWQVAERMETEGAIMQ